MSLSVLPTHPLSIKIATSKASVGMVFFIEGVTGIFMEGVIGFSFFVAFLYGFLSFLCGFFTVFYKNIAPYSPDFPRLQAFFADFCGFLGRFYHEL